VDHGKRTPQCDLIPTIPRAAGHSGLAGFLFATRLTRCKPKQE
jgi:hypothetical protein